MIDARYDAARRTDQSGDRGWAFDPTPSVNEYRRPSFLLVLAAVGVAVALVAAWLT